MLFTVQTKNFFFFKVWFTPYKAEEPLRDMEVQDQEAQQDYSIWKICLERTYSWKMSVNSGLKATNIVGQRKAFYRQRIREFSCAMKKIVDIDILVTSRNGDIEIMQSIRKTTRPPSRKRTGNQLIQFWRTSTKVIPIEKT